MLGSLLATSGTSRPCRLVRAVMLRSCIALVGAVAAFGSIPSMAADIPAIGSTATGFIDIARMQVPLPAGTWVLAGRSYSSPADLDAVAYGAIESDVLLQVDNKTATSFVIIDRNIIPVEDGWSTSQDCGKEGLVAPANYLTSETHVFCSFIQRVKTFQRDMNGANGAWKGAIDYARTNGIQVPSTWFMVGYRRTDRRELLDVRYHFASSSLKARATTAQSSQPSAKVKVVAFSSEPPRISAPVPGDPAHARSVVALLERWRDLMRGPVESGFNNALTAEFSLASPGADDAAALPPGIAMKLKSLDDLRDRNVVTDIDYRLQRAAIIATSVKLMGKNVSNEELTLWKTIADQTTAGAANLVIDVGVLGNPIAAVGLFSVQRVFDMFQYTSHEWAWNTYGPRSLQEAPPMDLPGASPASSTESGASAK